MKTTAPKATPKALPSLSGIPVPSGEASTPPAAHVTASTKPDADASTESTGSGSNAETIIAAVQRAASMAGRISARNRQSSDQAEKTTGNSKRSVTTVKFTGDGLNETERNALALLKAVALVEKLTGAKLHLALAGK